MNISSDARWIGLAAAAATVGFFVNNYLQNRFANSASSGKIKQGAVVSDMSGSSWTSIANQGPNQLEPQQEVWRGPGNQQSNSSFNGQIFTKRFNKGGNHNSTVNYEQSYAFQTSTKNPFANGTNNSYASAVANATQDPTNQATALVLGPGIAPNND